MQVHKYWGTACVLLKMTKVSGLETLSTTLSWLSMAPGCNGGGTIFNWLPWQKEPVSTSASNTQISLSVADVFLILCAMFLRFLVKYIPAPYFWSDKRKKKKMIMIWQTVLPIWVLICIHSLVLQILTSSWSEVPVSEADTRSCSVVANYH